MSLSGISLITNNQSVERQTESQSVQDDTGNSTSGWKYLTVREGGKVYTYIVIGKNMKILIGESWDNKDKDKKANSDKEDTVSNSGQANTTAKTVNNKILDEQTSFFTDFRMLGLTAEYQKKMRETIKNMENNIGYGKVDQTNAKVKDRHKKINQ